MESAMAWTIRVKTASCAVGGGDDDMASAGTESNVERDINQNNGTADPLFPYICEQLLPNRITSFPALKGQETSVWLGL
uniref:Uncharacterized protein n=1 Tax=Oryza meridionalis TaxID=40149 RepID=A0A0E0DVW7_9ORYZ